MMMMLLYDEINTCIPSIIIEILHYGYLQSVKPSIVFFICLIKECFGQILKLLHPKDRQIGRGLLRVACTTISLMAAQNSPIAEKYLIQPLCRPLIQSTEYHGN